MKLLVIKQILLVVCVFILSACDDSVEFKPQFKVSNDSVFSDINKIIETEKINITGYKIQLKDTLIVNLSVQLINAKNIPAGGNAVWEVERDVARKIKKQLKDSSQFKSYSIIFIQRDTTKSGIGTFTKENGIYPRNFNANKL